MTITKMEKLLKEEANKRGMKLSKTFIHLGGEAILTKKGYSDDKANYYIDDFLTFVANEEAR